MEKKTVKRIFMMLSAVLTMLAVMAIQKPLISEAKSVSDYTVYWSNVNPSGVYNGPTSATKFTVPSGKKLQLDAISLYHYNYGSGKTPGKITLKKGSTKIGTWSATGHYYNQWWDVFPNKTLSAGTYTITCSSKSTWSYNSSSENAGFAEVYGKYVSSSSLGRPTIKSVKYYSKVDNIVRYQIVYSKVSKATGYQVQISKKKDFSTIFLKHNDTVTTLYQRRPTNDPDNTRFYVRVRAYKKSGSKTIYSKWSDTKSYIFSFKKPSSVKATGNLLVNGNAEKGSIKGWTTSNKKWKSTDGGNWGGSCKPYKGKRFFWAEDEKSLSSTSLNQTVSINSKYISRKAYVTAYTANWSQNPMDVSKVKITFLDNNGKSIGTASKSSSKSTWNKIAFNKKIPKGTKKIRVSLIGIRKNGMIDAYFDNVSLILK